MSTDGSKVRPAKSDSHLYDIFTFFVDRASLNGIIFAKDCKHPVVRTVWIVLLLAGTGALTYHLYSLVMKYLSYAKHSDVNIGFSVKEFPAITICNANIMRYSKRNQSKILEEFIDGLESSHLVGVVDESWPPDDATFDNFDNNEDADFWNDFIDKYETLKNEKEDEYYKKNLPNSWQATSNRSSLTTVVEIFKYEFSKLDIAVQRKVGHQLTDMLRKCTFATRLCHRNYTQFTSSEFGNCFTIQNDKFITTKSGPSGGMELILYIETDEYLPIITSGKGVQLIIHDPDTVPLPDQESISVSAGEQTMVAIKQTRITRLGDPYIPCKSAEEFSKLYGIKYTRNVCQRICLLKRIIDICQCYDPLNYHVSSYLNITNIKPCLNDNQTSCIVNTTVSTNWDDATCACYSPCSEKVYDQYISSKVWPNEEIMKIMVEELCLYKPAGCASLKNKTYVEQTDDFVKINIYYQDLNYADLSEQPNYEVTQLLSDIGGSLGLWIGLSILSLFEIVHLFFAILHQALCRRRRGSNEAKISP